MTTAANPLTGAFNFRDVGGATIRRGRLFRSDTLQALTPADQDVLTGRLGVRCVLDLRTAGETVAEGRAALADICYVNVPLRTTQGRRSTRLEEIYVDHLENDSNLPVAIELLSTLLPRPTVVHCASGKDRTGIVTALVLGLAGASRDAILHDYLRSAYSLPRVIERFRAHGLPEDLFRCTESTIGAVLDSVEHDFGGFTGWAKHAGVPNDAVRRLQGALHRPAGEAGL